MPSNQQRREAAKRKLERQLARREERDRQRRQRLIVIGAVAAVLVVTGVVVLVTTRSSGTTADAGTTTSDSATSSSGPATPCTYVTTDVPAAAKDAKPPSNLSPANTGTVAAELTINGQPVPVTLNRAEAPCTVNSFLSLASQGFYNDTPCHRLTASPTLSVLQCGDPSGTGSGGPGYTFADEVKATAKYPAGTLAMANSGADTNGSQFFIVYKDSKLSPAYTVFGTVSAEGMKAIDAIAAKGVADKSQDGAPAEKVTITKVTVPEGAVTATGSYPSTAAGSGAEESGAGDSDTGSGTDGSATGSSEPATSAATSSG